MELTVIINCHDDPRIYDCINSIGENIEVIVVLAGKSSLEQEFRQRGITFINTELGNMSRNCNRGSARASHDNILIVDSDCKLAPQCIERVYAALQSYEMVRCRISFLSDGRILLSDIIARLRSSVNNQLPIRAYTPGLAFRRSVASKLGGYLFDEDVTWASDSELNQRVKAANIYIHYDPDSVVYHHPISFWHEVRSGYRLGRGQREIVEKGLRPDYESFRNVTAKLLTGQSIKAYIRVGRLFVWKGLLVIVWWDLAYHIGYYSRRFLQK